MPLDPNIILGVKPLEIQNPLDAMGKMMAMRSLATKSQTEGLQAQQAQQEFNDQQALRNAKANNTKVNSDGTVATDQQGILKELGTTAPSLVSQVNVQQRSQAMDAQNQQIKNYSEKMGMAAQLSAGVKDQPSLDQLHKTMEDLGVQTTQVPTVWDDKSSPAVMQDLTNMALTAQQRAENQIKQQEADNKKQELAMEYHKTYGGFMPGQGPQSAGAPTAPGAQVDPSTLVPQTVPTAQQAKAFEEIKDNQNIAKIAGPSIAAFDQAAKEVRPMTGGTGTSMTAFVPHIPFVGDIESAGQKAFSGAANTTVKDVEGTARQAAFESLKNNFRPQFGDSDATIASKRAGWINYLASHSAAPVNKAYGIDLQKYPSTSFDSKTFAGNDKKVIDDHPQDATAVAWAKANPGPKADKILELNGVGK